MWILSRPFTDSCTNFILGLHWDQVIQTGIEWYVGYFSQLHYIMAFFQGFEQHNQLKSKWVSDKLDQLHLYISLLPLHQHPQKTRIEILNSCWVPRILLHLTGYRYVWDHCWVPRILLYLTGYCIPYVIIVWYTGYYCSVRKYAPPPLLQP